MNSELAQIQNHIAVLGVGQVALDALLAVQVGAMHFDRGRKAEFADIESHCRQSVYWPEFCKLAQAGQVPANWLPGALGVVVLEWAKGGNRE